MHQPIVSTLTATQQARLQAARYLAYMTAERDLTTPAARVAWAIEREKERGVNLEALAKAIGCTHATLSQWQTGATNVVNAKGGLLAEFSKLTGVSLLWLLTGTGDRIERYTSSERLSRLAEKLSVMEQQAPAVFEIVAKLIDSAADGDETAAPRPPS